MTMKTERFKNAAQYIEQVVQFRYNQYNKLELATVDKGAEFRKKFNQTTETAAALRAWVKRLNSEVGYEINKLPHGSEDDSQFYRWVALSASKMVIAMGLIGARLTDKEVMNIWWYARSSFMGCDKEEMKIRVNCRDIDDVSWTDWRWHIINFGLPMVDIKLKTIVDLQGQ